MENKIFEVVLQTISIGLVEKIMIETEIDEDSAMEALYSSELYSALEKEETKMWHYSISMLYKLFKEETTSNKLTLPAY